MAPKPLEATLYEVRKGAAWITLNRPETRNALSAALVEETFNHIKTANETAAVRAIVLIGAGTAFCAGADLKNPPGSASGGGRAISLPELLTAMLESPKPVIAAINGAAFAGGLGLVGAADIVIADEAAPFSFSEVRIGVIPAVISVVCAPKLGQHAMKLFITGERFTGAQAVAYGLAHSAVPASSLHASVEEVIDMIRLGGPQAVAGAKQLVRRVPQLSVEDGFKEMAAHSVSFFTSAEGKEGMAAFREKRKPAWTSES